MRVAGQTVVHAQVLLLDVLDGQHTSVSGDLVSPVCLQQGGAFADDVVGLVLPGDDGGVWGNWVTEEVEGH